MEQTLHFEWLTIVRV